MQSALVPPGTYALATVLALAVALTLLAQRASGAPALRNWHRWLYPLVVLAWLASLWVVALRLMASASFAEFVARAILVAGLITAILPLLRDLLAGFAIAMEARFRVGDEVRIGHQEGKIVHLGLRSIIVRCSDKTERILNNRHVHDVEVVRRCEEPPDAPCEWEIEFPPEVPLAVALERLEQAVMLSPYAAPGHRPESFVARLDCDVLAVRVKCQVFDRAYRNHFYGDVVARLRAMSEANGRNEGTARLHESTP